MKIKRIGVDLAKNVFQIHGVDKHGKLVYKRQLKRANWLRVLTKNVEPGCTVGMDTRLATMSLNFTGGLPAHTRRIGACFLYLRNLPVKPIQSEGPLHDRR